jgi:hypothetical protein
MKHDDLLYWLYADLDEIIDIDYEEEATHDT